MYYHLLFLLVLLHQLYMIFNMGIDQCQSSHADISKKPLWGEKWGELRGAMVRRLEMGVTPSSWYLIPNHLGWLTTPKYSTLTPTFGSLAPTDFKLPHPSPRDHADSIEI